MPKSEHLKDVLPGEQDLALQFEVYSKLEDTEETLTVRICDETGISTAVFGADVKKYIDVNQLYIARFAKSVVVNEHLRIELMK